MTRIKTKGRRQEITETLKECSDIIKQSISIREIPYRHIEASKRLFRLIYGTRISGNNIQKRLYHLFYNLTSGGEATVIIIDGSKYLL